MSEFNGKKYYGFSLHNDPALLTTTRNFEFRYTLPENLDRVIQKVQLSDAAESKNKKNLLAKYCKLKKQAARQTPYHTRDIDVETHMSRNDLLKVRNLSEQEIDQLIGKAKSTVNMVSGRGKADELDQKQKQKRSDGEPTNRTTIDDRPEKIVFEDCRLPQPKWVEIEENLGHVVVSLGDPKQPRLMTKPTEETASLPIECLEHTMIQQQQEIKKLQEKQEMHTEIKRLLQSETHATIGIHPTPLLAASEMEPPEYYVEDSDYEYEMLKRPDYAKYCEHRPTVDEMTNVSNDSGGGVAKFIEIEPHIPCMDLSFLKNAKPIRYTDLTDELPEEERLNNCQMMDYIKGMKEFNSIQKMENEPQPTDKKASKKEAIDKKELAKRKIFPYKPMMTSQAPRASQLSPRKSIKNLSIGSAQNSPKSNKSKSPRNPNSDRAKSVRPKNLVLTKSLEELKMEKVALFGKMNGTQERIIEMLDKLRMNLLEASVPENNYEKNRRQKNTMEFSVRFSRNFLYPLRGMIDYLHNTTPEHFNSSSSNEACTRVAAIYALMLQSLQTYQRQLRFFMLSQVPQKLSALIEVVQSTTKLCLEKGVFDMNDPIIECLLDRCSKFVGFLADLHNQRFTAARDNYRKTHHDKKSSVHDKYDLKMFMNDLNMYEPKLVPKRQSNMRIPRKGALTITTSSGNTTARRRPRRCRKDSNIQLDPPPFSSEMALTKAAEDAIATQIQSLDSSDILSSVQNITKLSQEMIQDKDAPEALNPLNKAVIEALQLVTKQQVRQVLEPIIQTLGTALDKKDFFSFMYKQLVMCKQVPVADIPLRAVASNAV